MLPEYSPGPALTVPAMRKHEPRVIFDADRALIAVDATDADALRDYLFRHGIHGTVSFAATGRTARLDVSDVAGEWAWETLRHWPRPRH